MDSSFIDLIAQLPVQFWLLAGFVILVLAASSLLGKRHFRNKVRAWFRLKKLQKIAEPAMQFGFLRYTDPFVFEEMILTAFKHAGFKIKRNKRYTGDGGIDGVIFINGQRILIQAKRYKAHINAAHVTAFQTICKKQGCHGLFIHTGKTGKQSWRNREKVVDIISGERMLDLLVRREFSV